METQLQASRCRRPGMKRLVLILSIVISFIVGLPFCMKSTEIFRAPLPFASVEEHTMHVMSSSILFPCYFHFVFVEEKIEVWDASRILQSLEEAVKRITKAMHEDIRVNNSSYGGCGTSFVVMASLDAGDGCLRVGVPKDFPVWPCGLMKSNILSLRDHDATDEFLHIYSCKSFSGGGESSGLYTVLNIRRLIPLKASSEPQIVREYSSTISDVVIGKYRHAWFVGSRQDSSITVEETSLMSDIAVRFFMNGGSPHPQTGMSMEERGETLPLAADGQAMLSFSLLNAKPEDWIFDWDFTELEEHFLAPIVKALQPVGVLNVESQVLYYTPTTARSFWDSDAQKHVVSFEDLPFFVNANEWHLDTSTAAAGRSKVLHFAIYIPAANECPLFLKNPGGSLSRTNGFTSPGWGGVVIFNPEDCKRDYPGSVKHLSIEDLNKVMDVIIAQIRVLFGLPPATAMDDSFVCLPAINTAFSDWELDILVRRHSAADMASFAYTLRSLFHLVQSLPNMVVMEEIGEQVKSSLAAATAAKHNASLGLYHLTSESARKARSWAEEAFFQPSLMSLLYLPLEHHFAIYTPFFVPVLLHTILAAFKEIRRFRRELLAFRMCKV